MKAGGPSARLSRLQGRLVEAGFDLFLITHLPNIFYLCGFSGSSGALLVSSAEASLFTDRRYAIQTRDEVRGARVRIVVGSPVAAAGKEARSRSRRRAAFEPSRLTVAQEQELQCAAGPRVRWVGWDSAVERLRAIKSPEEIAQIRAAAHLAGDAFEGILPLVKPGVREWELAAEVEYRMRLRGASGPAFDTIVASGPRSALPHARAGSKPLEKNELVVFDLGAILRGYCSDLTRTVFLGRASARIRAWYRAVVEAQDAAREALRPGVTAGAVDAAARRILRRHGLERRFVHSLGHGLGLEVHEAPRLARGNKVELAAGNVVTLEPGVYVEGAGGIRIEDDVVITERGADVLTRVRREFIEL